MAIIQRHLIGDAQVEESAMLPSKATGEDREVDVVIRTTLGYPVIVSVEAVARSRKADRIWVDTMIGKHADLATNKLVLVSERGFSDKARDAAVASGALPLSPEDLASDDPAFEVVNAIPSLWPKYVSFTPEEVRVCVHQSTAGLVWFRGTPDLHIFLEDGEEVDSLLPVIQHLYRGNWPKLMEQIGLADIETDRNASLIFQVGPPWKARKHGRELAVCLRMEEGPEAGQLHHIEWVHVVGKAVIKVSEVPLAHRRLGEVMYAYGEGRVGEHDALLVASEDEQGGRVTVRFRDGESRTSALGDVDMPPSSSSTEVRATLH